MYVDAIVSRRKRVWEIYFDLQAFKASLAENHRMDRIGDDPDWARLPEVEAWLEWEEYTNKYSMKDDVYEFERY